MGVFCASNRFHMCPNRRPHILRDFDEMFHRNAFARAKGLPIDLIRHDYDMLSMSVGGPSEAQQDASVVF